MGVAIIAFVTALGGGTVRDMLIGAGIYLGLDYLGVSSTINFPITVALVATIRVVAVLKNIGLPVIRLN